MNNIQSDFEESLKKSSWWSRFLGSQFVSYLSNFVAQAVYRCESAASRGLQESFLSLATKRASILAGAEDKAYVGLKISPSTGIATVTNTGKFRISLRRNTPCIAQNLTEYTILDAVDLPVGASADVPISQLWLEEIRITVDDPKSWFSILLTKEMTAETHRIDVFVNGELWENRFKFRNTDKNSKCYMEYYKASDQLGIRFGNGINGRIPQKGDRVLLKIWCTNGESTLIDNQKLQLTDESKLVTDAIDITTKTPITGGAPGDEIEDIRSGALYTTSYDHQIAWDSDYEQFIKTHIGGLIWLSVWGEKQQEELKGRKDLTNINKIFFSAYSDVKSDEKLEAEIIDLFDGREGYNEFYQWVDRIDQPFTIHIKGFTFLNSKPSDAEVFLKDELNKYFGKDTKNKPHRILIQDLWDIINDLSKQCGIDEFTVTSENLPQNVPVGTYSYLDITNSTFDIQYGSSRNE
ncbi:baseplate J/gp47 family protein [Photobacterium leiognathi]|uniref:hypothetical protein n=1 Tax=Photobacterium leiognathi TaxID=553611 RepID=UPI0029817CF4|nr:hypothetical protein [Photobacterium leiognathi]